MKPSASAAMQPGRPATLAPTPLLRRNQRSRKVWAHEALTSPHRSNRHTLPRGSPLHGAIHPSSARSPTCSGPPGKSHLLPLRLRNRRLPRRKLRRSPCQRIASSYPHRRCPHRSWPLPPSISTPIFARQTSRSPFVLCSPFATTAPPRLPAFRCKSPPRLTGNPFASTHTTPFFTSPPSTPTPTTPASCTKPLSRSTPRSCPVKPSSST